MQVHTRTRESHQAMLAGEARRRPFTFQNSVARWLTAVVGALLLVLAGPLAAPVAADPVSPLVVTNVATPSPVTSGTEITYSITTTNSGGAKASNLVMSDQLNGVGTIQSPPAAPQFVITSTKGTCTQSGQLVTCNGGTLNGGESWTVTIRGVVTAPGGTTLNNVASFTGTKSAQNFTTTATAQTQVLAGAGSGNPLPDLTLNKTGPSTVVGGANFDYILTVNNLGGVNASGITVRDTLPTGVVVNSIDPTSLFTCSTSGAPTVVLCIGGAVNQGQNASITLHVQAPATGPLTNTAVVDPDNTIAESNELNNTSATVNTSVTASAQPPAITIVKTDDPAVIAGAGPDPVSPLQTLTYKIRVTNTSTTRADDVVVTDGTQGLEAASVLATQAIVNGALGTGNGCVVSAPTVRCTIKSLNPGGTLNITISGTVIAPAGTVLINTATATANIRNTGVTATATERTTVKPGVDLTITKAASPDPVCASSFPAPAGDVCVGGLKYTFVVGNSGIQPANNVLVRDVLPPGTIYDSFTNGAGSDFACVLQAGNVLECTNPQIGTQTTESYSIILVAPATAGPISNTATVDPGNAIFESDETNNTATVTSQVSTGIDLTIFKLDEQSTVVNPPGSLIPNYPTATAGFDPIATSGTQTYTIYVDNLGTQDASNVRVSDTLPAGTKFLGASGNAGFTCSHDGAATGGIVTCVGGSLLGTKAEFYNPGAQGNQFATITITLSATPFVQPAMHNEVRVDPLNEIAEVNENNNIATADTVVKTTGGGGQNAFNQLTIVKTATPEVSTSSVITYGVTIGNTGTDPAVNVTFRDVLPAGTAFISASDNNPGPNQFTCSAAAGVVTCIGATLSGTVNTIVNAPATRTVTIKAFAPTQPGNITNTATVDPNNAIPEGDETDNSSDATTKVVVGAGYIDLQVTKCDGAPCPSNNNPVAIGHEVTYVITATNAGTDPAFQVVVRDELPAGVAFLSASDTTLANGAFLCGYASGVVTCTGGALDGTANLIPTVPSTRTIAITVRVLGPKDRTLTNQVFIDPANTIAESDETNNSATDTSLVVSPFNAKVTKTGPSTATQNNTADYTIKVENTATDPMSDLVVVDPLPVGLIPLGVEADGNWQCTVEENPVNNVRCVGDLAPGDTVTIVVHTFVTQDGGTLDNEACADPDNVFDELDEGDNCSTQTTDTTKRPDITVQKSADSGTVGRGETLTYTISVSNVGTGDSDAFNVTDLLPTSVSIVGTPTATNGVTCTHDGAATGGIVTCTFASGLTVGASTTITIQTTVTDNATTAFTNTAAANGGGPVTASCGGCGSEVIINNNTSSVTTSVEGSAIDLSVGDITDNPDPAGQGAEVTYTTTITNGGSQNALTADGNQVVIRADLPNVGVTLGVFAASEGFSCVASNANAVVTCTGDLLAGASTTLTIPLTIQAGAPPKLTVKVTADPLDAILETNEANNAQQEDTTVVLASCTLCVDVVAGQVIASVNPAVNDTDVTYQFVVTNVGDLPTESLGDLIDVKIFVDLDTIFNESTLVSVEATNGFTCGTNPAFILDTTAPELLCEAPAEGLGPGGGTLVTVVAHVNTSLVPSFVAFDVAVPALPGELTSANNTGHLTVNTVAP